MHMMRHISRLELIKGSSRGARLNHFGKIKKLDTSPPQASSYYRSQYEMTEKARDNAKIFALPGLFSFLDCVDLKPLTPFEPSYLVF